LSIFRFYRDLGYVAGAVLASFSYAALGLNITLIIVALLTLFAGAVAEYRMCCTKKIIWVSKTC
jgi:hypothetical protein